MRLREIEKHATEMEISLNQAIGARRAYLWREFDYYLNCETDPMTWDVICKPEIESILAELYQLKMDIYYKSRPVQKGDITDEMKQRARNFPVTQLVELVRGRALAFCHEDKRPSLYLASRVGKLVCPVCDKYFDAVDVLMLRDGMNFPTAVRALQGGGT